MAADDSSGPTRTRLTRGAVVATALAVVDADGLSALTMRRLGTELGVDPMAAYRHVSGKADLLDAIVEAVLAEIEIPERTGPWDAWFARLARNFRSTLLSHPHTLPVVSTRPPVTPAAWQPVEAALAVLVDGGFGLQSASDAVDCMTYLVLGHVTAEVGVSPGPDSAQVDASARGIDGEPRSIGISACGRGRHHHRPRSDGDLRTRPGRDPAGVEGAAEGPVAPVPEGPVGRVPLTGFVSESTL